MALKNEYKAWAESFAWSEHEKVEWLLNAIGYLEGKLDSGQQSRNYLYENIKTLEARLKELKDKPTCSPSSYPYPSSYVAAKEERAYLVRTIKEYAEDNARLKASAKSFDKDFNEMVEKLSAANLEVAKLTEQLGDLRKNVRYASEWLANK